MLNKVFIKRPVFSSQAGINQQMYKIYWKCKVTLKDIKWRKYKVFTEYEYKNSHKGQKNMFYVIFCSKKEKKLIQWTVWYLKIKVHKVNFITCKKH